MKIQTKIAKLQVHENLHKYMLHIYAAYFLYGFQSIHNGDPFVLDIIKFSQFWWSKCFFPKFNRPLVSTLER